MASISSNPLIGQGMNLPTHQIATLFLLTLFGSSLLQAENGGLIEKTLKHDDLNRDYYIHLPTGFKKESKLPLVLALHGGGGRAIRFSQGTTNGTLIAGANKRGVIIVFPQGIDRKWNDGRNEERAHDDVGFISKLIDMMIKDYGADPKRVYATGISNGGFMSLRLAMELTDKVAAIAPVTAQIPKAMSSKSPSKPISVMVINGTKDPLVPYIGGHVRIGKFGRSRGEVLSTEETIARFVKHNGCKPTSGKVDLPDMDPKDQTRVSMTVYSGGEDGTEVVLVKVSGGGHAWPGGKQYFPPSFIGVLSRDINASEMILDFFLRHSR